MKTYLSIFWNCCKKVNMFAPKVIKPLYKGKEMHITYHLTISLSVYIFDHSIFVFT